jgi:hypothetical protein
MKRNYSFLTLVLFVLFINKFLYGQSDNNAWGFMKFRDYSSSGTGKVGVRFIQTIQDVYDLDESVRWSWSFNPPAYTDSSITSNNDNPNKSANIIHIGGNNFGDVGNAFYPSAPTEEQLITSTEQAVSAWNSALSDCQSIYYLCAWSYFNDWTGSEDDIIEITFNNSPEFWNQYFSYSTLAYGNPAGYKDEVGDKTYLNLFYEGIYSDVLDRTNVNINTTQEFAQKYVLSDALATDGKVNIKRILAHEIGHTLGLEHLGLLTSPSHIKESIMYNNFIDYPTWGGGLTIYDKAFISMLYSQGATEFMEDITNTQFNQLYTNHPNPFNPSTTISYSLADNIQNPKIEIYNIKGQKVKSYRLEEKAGENSIIWHGKDENDRGVSSGVYFYRLLNEGKVEDTKKMLLIK